MLVNWNLPFAKFDASYAKTPNNTIVYVTGAFLKLKISISGFLPTWQHTNVFRASNDFRGNFTKNLKK